MIYVYDILLNFNHDLYEFYEWEKSDLIYHIKKIPMYRVSSSFLSDVVEKKIKIDDPILLEVKDKTEVFDNKRVNTISYACLLTDSYRVIAILLDQNGHILKRSHLILDEEEDTLSLSIRENIRDISYNIVGDRKDNRFLTRHEIKVKKFLKDEIKKAFKAKDKNKLKYLYFEYFNEYSLEIDKIYEELLKTLDIVINERHMHLYELLKLCNEYQIGH